MAFLQRHTANLTPHPAPVAPLADQSGQRNEWGVGFKVAKWGMFFYPKTLQSRPARLK